MGEDDKSLHMTRLVDEIKSTGTNSSPRGSLRRRADAIEIHAEVEAG
jgi:hypothetical protein